MRLFWRVVVVGLVVYLGRALLDVVRTPAPSQIVPPPNDAEISAAMADGASVSYASGGYPVIDRWPRGTVAASNRKAQRVRLARSRMAVSHYTALTTLFAVFALAITNPFASGTRQWARKTVARIAVSTAVLGAGEPMLDEQGGVYGGDGSTVVNMLARAMRIGEYVHDPTAPQYGAKGDGSTDDTVAVQNALNDAATANGFVYLRRNKTFAVSALQVKSYCGIQGAGTNTIIKQRAGATTHLITLFDYSQTQVWFRDFQINGNSANQTVACDGINLDHTGGDGTLIPSHRIYNVRIISCHGNGLTFGTYSREVVANTVRIYNCDGYGLYLGGADSKLSNIDVGQSGLTGVYMPGSAYQISNIKSWFSGRIDGVGGGFLIGGQKIQLVGAYSQDNMGHGYQCYRSGVILTGITIVGISENDNATTTASPAHFVGLALNSTQNSSFTMQVRTYSGGRNGVPWKGVTMDAPTVGSNANLFSSGNEITATVTGTSSYVVDGAGVGLNAIRVNGCDSAVSAMAFTGTWTPNPWAYRTYTMTLTGASNVSNPGGSSSPCYTGKRLTFYFTSDSNARTVTFGGFFTFLARTGPSVTIPAGKTYMCEFLATAVNVWTQTADMMQP